LAQVITNFSNYQRRLVSIVSLRIQATEFFYNVQGGHKVTTLQTFIKYKVQEILKIGLRCLKEQLKKYHGKVGCLHPVACTRSGSGFPSNATLV
jgi:hypothetical protein